MASKRKGRRTLGLQLPSVQTHQVLRNRHLIGDGDRRATIGERPAMATTKKKGRHLLGETLEELP